jgi:hypothetical protein
VISNKALRLHLKLLKELVHSRNMLTVVLLVFASYKTKAHVVDSTIASNTNSVQQGHIKLIALVRSVDLHNVGVFLNYLIAIRVRKEETAHIALVIVFNFVLVLRIISITFSDLKLCKHVKESFNYAITSKVRSYKLLQLILNIREL